MNVPTERQFRTFNSWDEVSPGDTLLWIVNGKYQGTTIEFQSFAEGSPYSTLIGKALELPEDDGLDPEDYADDDWATSIYPSHPFVGAMGWAISEGYATFKYDPKQQPEDDSI